MFSESWASRGTGRPSGRSLGSHWAFHTGGSDEPRDQGSQCVQRDPSRTGNGRPLEGQKREGSKLNPQKVWMEGKPLVATKLGRGFLVVLGDLMKSQPLNSRVGKLREVRASFFTCLQVRGFKLKRCIHLH